MLVLHKTIPNIGCAHPQGSGIVVAEVVPEVLLGQGVTGEGASRHVTRDGMCCGVI